MDFLDPLPRSYRIRLALIGAVIPHIDALIPLAFEYHVRLPWFWICGRPTNPIPFELDDNHASSFRRTIYHQGAAYIGLGLT
jgi:hypothetical protein